MSVKPLLAIMALTALPLLLAAPPAVAQSDLSPLAQPSESTLPQPQPRQGPRRIEIYPQRLLYRRCVDWYELQNRPSGTVLFPQMHCWWVRG
jgi:hypothetical protein